VEDRTLATMRSLKDEAKELRDKIIHVVSKNGGHLGASLGATDLILSLHKVFLSPHDRIIFDTGHQAYAHKLLTGRLERFDTLRTYTGLCGFTDPTESVHDHFFAGHAGTALSLALGVHDSTIYKENAPWTIALIGDASLSCGLTLEALNNIHSSHKRLLIVLNDNGMSISKGCGNLHDYLQKIRNFPFLSLKENFKDIFSIFNCKYVGPVDGHEPEEMVALFEKLKLEEGPFLVHVKTIKGFGLEYAETSPTVWHGPKPFCIESGTFKKTTTQSLTFPKIFGKHLFELKKKEPNLHVITPATATGACLEEFGQAFPREFHDVGIAEGHAVTYAAGLCRFQEFKVILSIYATFLHRALDNLFHDVVLQNIPLILAIDRAGLSPQDGSTHHGIYDISFLKTMPGLVIAQPRNATLLKDLFESALVYNTPIAIRYPNLEAVNGSQTPTFRPLGKGEILVRSSSQKTKILIISLGHMAATALNCRLKLLEQGLDATIFDPIFLKPLDEEELLPLLQENEFVFVIEEHAKNSGLGSIILNFLFEKEIFDKRVYNFGFPDRFYAHGSYSDLLDEAGLTENQIFEKMLLMIRKNGI
jgi:1-deoxy-D-xylulose-5-phosphate synthase